MRGMARRCWVPASAPSFPGGAPKLTCKPRSVPALWKSLPSREVYAFRLRPSLGPWAIIPLGRRVAARLKRPTRGLPGRASPTHRGQTLWASPLFGLAPDGGCLAVDIAADAGGLLHHHFTLAASLKDRAAICFSVALFRQVTPPRALPGVSLSGARTFLGAPGRGELNLTPARRDRPANLGTLTKSNGYTKPRQGKGWLRSGQGSDPSRPSFSPT
jgi:hypothetical protein